MSNGQTFIYGPDDSCQISTYSLSVMAEPKFYEDVPNVKSDDNADFKEQIYLEETFFIEKKKKTPFRVLLTSKRLSLIKEDSTKDQTLLLQDIIGSKCMRSKRRRVGGNFCVFMSFVSRPPLKVVDEDSGDLDENDISAYLYIYAYDLKRSRRKPERERTTITLRFISYDKYEDNNREAQRWRNTINCLIANEPITNMVPQNDKKLLILLNPKSGSGKAVKLFQSKVASILNEAQIPYYLRVTENAQYAREYIRTLKDIYVWRGIVAVGGDGVLFEVLNGIFERLDWQQVLTDVPLGIIPCGSGNGLARTICHHYNEPYIPHDLTGMSMALVRGKTAHMDVVRVETKSRIMFSFLSVGWGLLADIDIESERLRVMGGQRFAFWALARLISLRKYKGVISYARIKDVSNLPKPKFPLTITHSVSHDCELDSPDTEDFVDCYENTNILTNVVNGRRHKRGDSWHSTNSKRSSFYSIRGSEYHSVTSSGSEMRSPVHVCMNGPGSHLPSLMSQLPSHWEREEGEFVMAYVSYQTYIGEDLLFAPRSQLSDGVMWLLIMKAGISRSQIFSFLVGMSHGSHSEINDEYIKMIPVSAFRIVPEGSNGYITVDGELVEYGPIQAEIFPNIVNLLVPTKNV